MDEDVPQPDDLPEVWDPGGGLGSRLVELAQRLADDLELALDGRME